MVGAGERRGAGQIQPWERYPQPVRAIIQKRCDFSVFGKRQAGIERQGFRFKGAGVQRIANSVPAGVYLLSVRGADGNSFAERLTHNGGRLNVSAAFAGTDNAGLNKSAASDYGRWTITVSADGYHTEIRTFEPAAGANPVEEFTLIRPKTASKANFTDTVVVGNSKIPIEMIYIPGGTFTIGCEKGSGCPANTSPVSGVTVSSYYIGKTEVTTAMWDAVMTGTPCSGNSFYNPCTNSYTSMTWFDAMEFACKLGQMTGRNYRMPTEAEWEYAVKTKQSSLEKIGGSNNNEEWAYNSWSATHSGGTDPVGPASGGYTQKTRRDATSLSSDITARLIRSVEGIGPVLRLAVSADTDYPPNYVAPCYLHMPEMGGEPENSYRDQRWVTGSDAHWTTAGGTAIGGFDFVVWEDGTAMLVADKSQSYCSGPYAPSSCNDVPGQWFTSNNIAFVFVPNSTTRTPTKYAYIFLDGTQGSVICDKGYSNYQDMGYIGRIERKEASGSYVKPTISGLMSGKELAQAQANFATEFKMWDMTNIPAAAKQKDPRLLDGPDSGWSQKNVGSAHHYRKDVDLDEFRFTVNQGSSMILANGDWFTVNNTFLRVTHPTSGYTAEYLYAVSVDNKGVLTFYHNSFMGYERGDFRMFTKAANGPDFNNLCTACSNEIPKGQSASFYAQDKEKGQSTFVPAPCPAGGCQ